VVPWPCKLSPFSAFVAGKIPMDDATLNHDPQRPLGGACSIPGSRPLRAPRVRRAGAGRPTH